MLPSIVTTFVTNENSRTPKNSFHLEFLHGLLPHNITTVVTNREGGGGGATLMSTRGFSKLILDVCDSFQRRTCCNDSRCNDVQHVDDEVSTAEKRNLGTVMRAGTREVRSDKLTKANPHYATSTSPAKRMVKTYIKHASSLTFRVGCSVAIENSSHRHSSGSGFSTLCLSNSLAKRAFWLRHEPSRCWS